MRPEELLVLELKRMNQTLSAAESCTGGYFSKRITDVSGASEVFAGACVTYTCDAKVRLIGVTPATLETYGAVSEQTAREMAEGVRRTLGTDYGVAVTGIAGPGGGTPEQPVGTVWIAAACESETVTKLLCLSEPGILPPKTREEIRFAATEELISLLTELFHRTQKSNPLS